MTSKDGVTLSYTDTNHPHAVTAAGTNTYSYDTNGNQVTRVVNGVSYSLAYDAENRLVTVKQGQTVIASYVYDGDGKRVQSTVGGVTTKFVGN